MEVWIGLVHVRVPAGSTLLDGGAGGFAPALALARNAHDFAGRVTAEVMERWGFQVVEIDDIEPLCARLSHFDVASEIRDLADTMDGANPIAFAAFDVYTEEEEGKEEPTSAPDSADESSIDQE